MDADELAELFSGVAEPDEPFTGQIQLGDPARPGVGPIEIPATGGEPYDAARWTKRNGNML